MKRMLHLLLAFGLTFAMVSMSSCGNDDDDNDDDGAVVVEELEELEPGVYLLEGRYTSDLTLPGEFQYLLRSAVFIEGGATLIIEPGAVIFGENSTLGTLVIAQGAKIMAEGTADAPIVFTSDQPVGSRGRGQWGGLIINGRAPINQGQTAFGEGDTGTYGGNDPNDSSGVLSYIRVEYAGIEFSPDNELNGIAFQGVGAGTQVDHVQVHFNQDDGIEFFGGTVNLKYALVTGARDDSFDWTDGWTGKGQFWVAQHRGDDADQGIEADNSNDDNDATPRSNPTVYNVTLIGDPDGPESDIGMLLREGTAGVFRNFIVTGFNESGLNVDQVRTTELAESGELTVANSIFFGNNPGNFAEPGDEGFDEAAWALEPGLNNAEVDPKLGAPFSKTSPDFRPGAGPATDGSVPVANPPSNGFFEPVNFIGGVDPNNDWTAGWTTTAQN